MGSFRAKLSVAVVFLFGFYMGYKAKEWRLLWLKRKRDRLADKLKLAQAELDNVAKLCYPKPPAVNGTVLHGADVDDL